MKYPERLIESTIQSFNNTRMAASTSNSTESDTETLRLVLPFKDQKCADVVKRQLSLEVIKSRTTLEFKKTNQLW